MVRKMILTAAVAMLVLPALASAQGNTVNATATVAQYSAVTGTDVLDFGSISRSVDTDIDAAGGAGAALRNIDYNHDITVTFTNVSANLTTGGFNLPVTLNCAWQLGVTWSAEAACSSASFDLDVGAALTSATLGFGGLITAANAAAAVAGTYTGSLDIVVTAR